MKRWLQLLKRPSQLRHSDVWLTLIPALLWIGATHSRSVLIQPYCSENPASCSSKSLLPVDQLGFVNEVDGADLFSYYTQNTAGILAFTVPVAWSGYLWAVGAVSPAVALAAMGTDLVLVAQTSFWNGLLNETTRLITQRPRPFVIQDPKGMGSDPAHYTSFYSGHTSFTATSMVALFLILLSRKAPLLLLMAFASLAPLLTFSTGALRVLAARHFITDVLVAGLAGTFVALLIALLHKQKRN